MNLLRTQGALSVALSLLTCNGNALAKADTSVLIQLKEIKILKEDDLLSNDEPYLISVGFKAKLEIGADSVPRIAPETLSVSFVGNKAHHNLGRNGDNWANRGGKYPFDSQLFGTVIPNNEPGWIVGVISALFEEDAYPDSTANELRTRMRDAVSTAITSLTFDSVDTNSITKAVASKVIRDLQRGAAKLDIAGLFRNLASAADPDDFGGVNIVLAMTMPMNGLMMFAGSPPENLGTLPTLTAVPAGGQTAFSLEYPAQVPKSVLWNARYRGKSRVEGSVIRGG